VERDTGGGFRRAELKTIIPACIGAVNVVAGRARRLKTSGDHGAFFLRFGVPLLVAVLLLVQFTDIERDFTSKVLTVVETVGTTFFSSDEPDF
jgi:hypothetical protein